LLNGSAINVSLRVAVVGCGRWGSHHLTALRRLRYQLNIELIVACDNDKRITQSLRQAGYTVHEDAASLVDEHQLDAVIVATPNSTHYSLGKMFLEQEVHALVEKPLSVHHDSASSLVSISVEKGKVLKTGFLLRFHPCVQDLHSRIRLGELGAIERIEYKRLSTREGDSNSNCLDSLAIHGLDIATLLLSEQSPMAISSVVGDERHSKLILEFPYQVEVEIEAGWGCQQNVAEFRLHGSNGIAIVRLNQHDSYSIIRDGNEEPVMVNSKQSPLDGQLIDFLTFDSKTTSAASTGSILRTIDCIEQARLKLASLGVKTARELKR
jgi:predicted dehydrogenase